MQNLNSKLRIVMQHQVYEILKTGRVALNGSVELGALLMLVLSGRTTSSLVFDLNLTQHVPNSQVRSTGCVLIHGSAECDALLTLVLVESGRTTSSLVPRPVLHRTSCLQHARPPGWFCHAAHSQVTLLSARLSFHCALPNNFLWLSSPHLLPHR